MDRDWARVVLFLPEPPRLAPPHRNEWFANLDRVKRLRAVWQSLWADVDRRVRLGRILGLLFVTAGFVVIGVAWNGAAGINLRIDSQFPYLLSGGFLGVGLIVTGATLLFLASVRAERQILTEKFDELLTLLGRNLNRLQYSANGVGASNGQVVAGANVYHRAECRILQGKSGLTTVTVEQAAAEGLKPCRVCNPPEPALAEADDEDASKEPAAVSSGGETPTP